MCNQDSMSNALDYTDLGLSYADVCGTLGRGINGRQLDELSPSVLGAIEQLTMWVEPAMHAPCILLVDVSITELQQRSRGISSGLVNEARSPGPSTQRAKRT